MRWKRSAGYHFAASNPVVELVVSEMPKACMCMPIAFMPLGEGFVPAAISGLMPGQNLYVTSDGRWDAPYIPAQYRGYPFALVNADGGQLALAMDLESGLLNEQYPEPLYDEQGEPSEPIRQIVNFLQEVRKNRETTLRICAALQKADLFEPWAIKIKDGGAEQTVQGLYRINEARFNNLEADVLYGLQQAGALPVVYCQLLSMQHIQTLSRLAADRLSARSSAKVQEPGFLSVDDTLRFDL